jgi:hypothetical protein
MSTTLDGQGLFGGGQMEIEVNSAGRNQKEIATPGLDGVLTIDLGRRSRQIRQTGTLYARSSSQMNELIGLISSFIDGRTHTLESEDRREFDNLRMDSFNTKKEQASAAGVMVDYEIIYTQLI